MGATNFETNGRGKTASEAFQKLVAEARHEYGHGGYTRTIAEKSTFIEFIVPREMTVRTFVDAIEEYASAGSAFINHPVVVRARKVWSDKWGPAVCVKTGEDQWLFLGWASE